MVQSADHRAGPALRYDAYFDRGGVKGIGMVGAVEALETAGYTGVRFAGVSTGAIIACLFAAGYRAADVKRILLDLDLARFMDGGRLGRIPVLGPAARVVAGLGIYDGDVLLGAVRDLLAAKGVRTFRDLVIPGVDDAEPHRYRASVLAADLTRRLLLVLPRDLRAYGLEPDEVDVAAAVRMSVSMPFIFRPVRLAHPSGEASLIVDGGLMALFPVNIFDSPHEPAWPTFGFRLVRRRDPAAVDRFRNPLAFALALYFTAVDEPRGDFANAHDVARTIVIDALDVRATDFRLSRAKKQALYDSGVLAAKAFLAGWDFERYKQAYRAAS